MQYIFRKKSLFFLVVIFDALGSLLVFLSKPFWRHKPAVSKKSPTILLIRMDQIGDVLYATFVPKAIKTFYPDCKISFLTSGASAALLKNNPYVDEVLVYNASWFGNKKTHSGEELSFFKLARLLKTKKFDMAFSLRGDLRENFLMAWAQIPRRIGYGITGGGFLLTDEADYAHGAHEAEHTANLLRAAGIPAVYTKPSFYFSRHEKECFDRKFKDLNVQNNDGLVAFQIEAGTSAKEWPEESMKRFAKAFFENFQGKKLLLVGQNTARGEQIARGISHCLNLTGKLNLREIYLLSEKLEAFIGHDSGPTHIAASSGVRTIYLFSGTNDWERWKPAFSNSISLREPVACSPCHLKTCTVKGHPCMSLITPEKLIAVFKREEKS